MANKWKSLKFFFAAMLLIICGALISSAAITTISGLAVAQTNTKWNNLKDGAVGDNLTNGVLANAMYLYDGTNFDRMRGDTAFGIDVDVKQTAGIDNTPADGYTNPTDAIDSNSLISEFNGTTWDRIRHSFNQSTASITTDAGAGTTVVMTTTPMNNYTLGVNRTAGATDVIEIDLECSGNNTNFFQIATVTSVAGDFGFDTQPDTPCLYMRHNIVTVGAGNTLTVQLIATR